MLKRFILIFSLVVISSNSLAQVVSDLSESCKIFPEAIKNCTPKTCTMPHLLIAGAEITFQVKGMVNGKCSYSTIDNYVNTECLFSKEDLQVISDNFTKFIKGGKISPEDRAGKIMSEMCVMTEMPQNK